MKKKSSLLILFFVLVPVFAIASMSGKDIYEQHLAVEKKMETALKGIIMEIESTAFGMVTKAVIYQKGDKSRVETTLVKSPDPMMGKPGRKTVIIDDGRQTTLFPPQMGKQVSLNEDEDESPSTVELLGKETVSGMDCHKLRLRFDAYGEVRIVWISSNDFLLVKEQLPGDPEMGEADSTEVQSDFRTVKGFKIPFKTETWEGGQKMETWTIQSMKADADIDDALFDPAKLTGFK